MKNILLPVFCLIMCQLNAQLNVELLSNLNYDSDGSDIWGYVDDDGSEYAIFGTFDGVSVVNVSDPSNPEEVEFINQSGSTWRDIKTWGDHAYVTSDQNGTTDGLLIIDLGPLPDSVAFKNINPNPDSMGVINTCHNLYIDEFGFAYLSGCNVNSGGLLIFDVASDPGTPVYVGKGPGIYSHDIYVRDHTAISSEINNGVFTIYNTENKDSLYAIGSAATPFEFTHNAWLSDDGLTLFTTDELPNASVASFDISDLSDIKLLDEFRPEKTRGTGVIPHNVHVLDNWLVISYYTDGLIIVDASRPGNLVEVGNYDTYEFQGVGFNGAWGAYPFLPSGNILIGDINSGLFVFKPDYVRAAYLEGQVTDSETGMAINEARISAPDIELLGYTEGDGVYKTGSAEEGTVELTVSAFGYASETRMVVLERGELVIEDFALKPLPRITVSGQVLDDDTGEAVPGARVQYRIQDAVTEIEADSAGNFRLENIISGAYDIIAGEWGYRYAVFENLVLDSNASEITIELEKGIEDIFSLDLGWSASLMGFQGLWERGDPIGQSPAAGITIAPEDDSDDPGREAYVTGNATSFNEGFLFGTATLTSPVFDLSAYTEPEISYQTWFWASDFQGDPSDETMIIYLANGTEEVPVDTIDMNNHIPFEWNKRDVIEVTDFIEPTAFMQIKAEVIQAGFGSAVEAGFDDFKVSQGETSSDLTSHFKSEAPEVYPNPFDDAIQVNLPASLRLPATVIQIHDVHGKLVESQPVGNRGNISIGQSLDTGIYFVRIRGNTWHSAPVRIVKK